MKHSKDMVDCFIDVVYWLVGVMIGLLMLVGVIWWVWEV